MNKNNQKLIDNLTERINRKIGLSKDECFYISNTVSRFFVKKWTDFLPSIYGTPEKQLEGYNKQQYYDFIYGCKDSSFKQEFKTTKLPTWEWRNKELSNGWTIDYTIYKVVVMVLSHPHLPDWWKQYAQNSSAAKEWFDKHNAQVEGWISK